MIAEEHKFIPVDEEGAPEPEEGLEVVERAGTGDTSGDGGELTARAQSRQLFSLGLAG